MSLSVPRCTGGVETGHGGAEATAATCPTGQAGSTIALRLDIPTEGRAQQQRRLVAARLPAESAGGAPRAECGRTARSNLTDARDSTLIMRQNAWSRFPVVLAGSRVSDQLRTPRRRIRRRQGRCRRLAQTRTSWQFPRRDRQVGDWRRTRKC